MYTLFSSLCFFYLALNLRWFVAVFSLFRWVLKSIQLHHFHDLWMNTEIWFETTCVRMSPSNFDPILDLFLGILLVLLLTKCRIFNRILFQFIPKRWINLDGVWPLRLSSQRPLWAFCRKIIFYYILSLRLLPAKTRWNYEITRKDLSCLFFFFVVCLFAFSSSMHLNYFMPFHFSV